jgi:steroid delta-isomerase-like uncharacterized protein
MKISSIHRILLPAAALAAVLSSPAAAQLPAQKKATVRRLFMEVANQGKYDVVDSIVAPNFVLHGNPPDPSVVGSGPQIVKQNIASLRKAFPDIMFTIQQMIVQGDMVAVRWTFTGTNTGPFGDQPATNKKATIAGMHFFRFANGKIVESWSVFDMMSLARELERQ